MPSPTTATFMRLLYASLFREGRGQGHGDAARSEFAHDNSRA
jgi:hypothetical protein